MNKNITHHQFKVNTLVFDSSSKWSSLISQLQLTNIWVLRLKFLNVKNTMTPPILQNSAESLPLQTVKISWLLWVQFMLMLPGVPFPSFRKLLHWERLKNQNKFTSVKSAEKPWKQWHQSRQVTREYAGSMLVTRSAQDEDSRWRKQGSQHNHQQ